MSHRKLKLKTVLQKFSVLLDLKTFELKLALFLEKFTVLLLDLRTFNLKLAYFLRK